MELENMVYIDALTGIYNRRYCLDVLERFFKEDKSFSFSLIDLDKLKHVNDTYGHLLGDEYLTFVSNVLSNNIGEGDIVCRIGGDEFAIIWNHDSNSEVISYMQKIENIIKNHHEVFSAEISYGNVHVRNNTDLTIKDVLREADILMYEMKQQHRYVDRISQENSDV